MRNIYIKIIIATGIISILHDYTIRNMLTDIIDTAKTVSVIDLSDSERDLSSDSELEII